MRREPKLTPEIQTANSEETFSDPARLVSAAVLTALRSYGIVVVAVVIMVVLSLTRDGFLSYQNITSLLFGVSLDVYVVIGFTILLIMGEVDLSVGSTYALSGMTAG